MQRNLDSVSEWTRQNLMKVNTKKVTTYFSPEPKTKNFQTRLAMAGEKIDRQLFVKVLGVWLYEDINNWTKNTTEI